MGVKDFVVVREHVSKHGDRGRPRQRPDRLLGDRGYDAAAIRSGMRARRVVRGSPCVVRRMRAVWAGGGGLWSGRLRGSTSFAVFVCGMTSAPTSTGRF